MWSISNLKNRGKEAFKRNYWKCVLVGLVVSMLVGGAGGASSGSFSNGFSSAMESASKTSDDDFYSDLEEIFDEEDDEYDDFDFDDEEYEAEDEEEFDSAMAFAALGIGMAVLFAFIIFALIVGIILDIFVRLPLEVGTSRFFFKNQKTEAKVGELAFAYDNHWKNIAITMFLRKLFIFLWCLLFIIPGIVKAYEYRMIPYILAENPDMDRKAVFALSKKLMDGEKWHAFGLDLSFIGWHLLSIFTVGVLEVFYVVPYQASTNATLYEALKYLKLERPQVQSEQTNL